MASEQHHWLAQTRQQMLQSSTAKNTVSANYAALLQQFLEQQSIDSAPVLAAANIAPASLSDPNALISSEQYQALIQACLTATANPAIGLEYGQRLNISTHGLLGFAVMSSTSVEKATELAMKYIQIRNQLIHIDFQTGVNSLHHPAQSGHDVAISFDVDIAPADLYRFEIDTSISSVFAIWRELMGDTSGVSAIHFRYPAPNNLSDYHRVFNVPVLFSQAHNAMCFNPAAFDTLARITDPTLTRIAEQQCESLLKTQGHASSQSLGHALQTLLLKSPGHFLNQQQAAEKLGLSSRTLSRKLQQEGQSFKSILDDVRKQLALQCLTDTQWGIDDIATLLTYSDTANFSRAVKRWTHLTPKQYRLAHS